METGKEAFDKPRFGETNGVVGEIMEPSVEDKASMGHASKDSEGDEVFEEAIEAESPVFCVEEGVVHYSVDDGGNSNSRDDIENFEEAVEAHEIQLADDESNQKTDNWSKQPSVEKQGAYEIAVEDETEVVEQNSILLKDKGEVSDVAGWEERKDLLHEPVDKSDNGGPDHVNMRETQPLDDAKETNPGAEDQEVHGKLDSLDTGARDQVVHGKLDTQDANEASGAANDLQNQVHSYKDALLRDEKNLDVIEPSAVQPAAGHQDSAGVHHYVSVTSGSVLRDERDIEKEGVHSLNLKPGNSDVNNGEQRDPSNVDASANDHLGEKEVSSPAKIHGIIMDEEQIDAESKIPSLVPANCSSKDEEQQIDSEKTVASQPFYGSDNDEELRIDGENVVPSPEPVNGSNKDEEQQIDGEKEVPKPDPGNGNKKSEEEMDREKVPKPDPGIGNKKSEEAMDGGKAMASPEPVNLKNKGENQINGPGYDADSTVQERSSPFKTEVIENEPTVQENVVEQDVPSGIATHQELKSDELPTMGSGNLNDKTNEQKYVSVSGTPPPENHTGMSVRARPSAEDVTSKSSETAAVAKSPSSSGVSATRTTTPAGLGRAAPLLEPAPRAVQQPRVNGTPSASQNQLVEESVNGEAEEYDETREKLQMIRVKFLRLAYRLGQSTHNVVVAQVLYRLGLAEQLRGRNGSRVGAFSFDRASAMAKQLEATGQEPLDFSCTIMVLGKTGVGKSATINSIFDEVKFGTDAFQMGTTKVQDVVGTVQGITVRIIDTPGLLPSWSDQRQNEKILHSIKRFIKKTPPDIVLYLDRLDMQSRDYGDMPLLRTITEVFGPSIWFNAIVVLTHAASAPPEGPNGTVTSYDMYVTQRSHVVQQAIRQAAGDMRLMNPVSLVENHSACRTNPAGQRVLPNGQVWKPHLLLLSFASKILAEANTLLKLQDSPPGRPYATRTRSPPLPFLLSSLLQSKPQVKLPAEQFDDEDDTFDDDLDESSDSEDESEYDLLPPFKRLTKAQVANLSKYQKKVYNDELEYREKLFMKKQLKEERKRRKMMKKMQAAAEALPTDPSENVDEETGGAASVPVPVPDLALPASFDSDNPTHRYRYLDSSNQWLVRPVLEPNGWDHDVGYEGINVEKLFVVKDKIPISFSSQVSKDKKDANLQMEVASSVKHGVGKATSVGFDMQSVGKDIAYTLRSETRFSNHRKNKVTAGLSTTLLGDVMTGGVKVEDKLTFNRRGMLVVSGGAMFGRGDVAYGGSLEATLRDKDHPLGRFLSTLGLSVMDWHGDLAIGCNSQTQIPIGRYTNLIGRVNINNKGSGQVSIRLNSSEQLQIALVSLIPLVKKLLSYSQPAQYG